MINRIVANLKHDPFWSSLSGVQSNHSQKIQGFLPSLMSKLWQLYHFAFALLDLSCLLCMCDQLMSWRSHLKSILRGNSGAAMSQALLGATFTKPKFDWCPTKLNCLQTWRVIWEWFLQKRKTLRTVKESSGLQKRFGHRPNGIRCPRWWRKRQFWMDSILCLCWQILKCIKHFPGTVGRPRRRLLFQWIRFLTSGNTAGGWNHFEANLKHHIAKLHLHQSQVDQFGILKILLLEAKTVFGRYGGDDGLKSWSCSRSFSNFPD